MSAYSGTAEIYFLSGMRKEILGEFEAQGQSVYNAYVNGTLIPQAENFIDTYCGGRDGTLRRFNSNLGTWRQDGSGKSVLFVPPKYTPLMGTPTITIDASAVSDTIIKIHDQFIQLDGASFRKAPMNVYLKGTHGYVTVPQDISYICGQLCANALLDMARRNTAEDAASAGPGRLDFNTMFGNPAIFGAPSILTSDMRNRLDAYRIKWTDLG